MPSRRSSLLATWLYSDIASTPSFSPSLRIVSDSMPSSSASWTAAPSTRSLLSGARDSGLGVDRDGTGCLQLGLRRDGRAGRASGLDILTA